MGTGCGSRRQKVFVIQEGDGPFLHGGKTAGEKDGVTGRPHLCKGGEAVREEQALDATSVQNSGTHVSVVACFPSSS